MKSSLLVICVLGCFSGTNGFFVNGGAPALAGEFKYVVGLIIKETLLRCTGGIISEKHILTAAHCLMQKNEHGTFSKPSMNLSVTVLANTTSFIDDYLMSSSYLIERKAVKAYLLTEYYKERLADIAILELESALNLDNRYLQKLELPVNKNSDSSYEDIVAVLAGFGDDYTGENDYSLKKTHLRRVLFSKCVEPYKLEHVDSRIIELLKEKFMCLISVTEDNKYPDHPLGACNGDSGGPVVHGKTIIEVITNAISCDGREKYPHLAADVTYYQDFINSVVHNQETSLSIAEITLDK